MFPTKAHKRIYAAGALSLCLSLFALNTQAEEIRVFAAASLTDAMNTLTRQYAAEHQGLQIKTSYASSATLAKQIEQGAPADIFLSADTEWVDYLEQRHRLLNGSRRDLLGNDLVLVAPKGRSFRVTMAPGFNLAGAFSGKLCTGDTESVPVGKYARQALLQLGWWDSLQPRLVGAEDVRTAAAFVERGECAAGIIYHTDLAMSQQLALVASFPSSSHKPIVYPGALTGTANNESRAFWAYLQSPAAAAVFVRYGFKVLAPAIAP